MEYKNTNSVHAPGRPTVNPQIPNRYFQLSSITPWERGDWTLTQSHINGRFVWKKLLDKNFRRMRAAQNIIIRPIQTRTRH
jgi:hypothetical protein